MQQLVFRKTKPQDHVVFLLIYWKRLKNSGLTYFINLTFETGTFPETLKTAKVIPICKKGNQQNKTVTITNQSLFYQI